MLVNIPEMLSIRPTNHGKDTERKLKRQVTQYFMWKGERKSNR